MGKEYRRNQRVAKEIQKKIAVILQQDIKDPRVSMATVSGVDLSRDLAYAKVFVSFFHNYTTEQVKHGVHKLQAAAGLIRGILGKTMYLRVMPEITFFYDNSLVEGMRMYKLVRQIAQKDLLYRKVSEAAEKKTNGPS